MTLEELTEQVRAKAAEKPQLNYVVRFDLKDGGAIRWDGTSDPPVVDNDDGEAKTTLRLSSDSLARMLDGRLSPKKAFMLGKLKVDGSTGVALKIAGYLDGGR